jgi:hypothetical protein
MSFDLAYKYRVVCGEDVAYTHKLSAAKLLAGELQAAEDRIVEIVKQLGRVRRWKATLEADGDVRMDELFDDGVAVVGNVSAERQRRLAALIEREEQRRVAKRNRRQQDEAAERARRSAAFGKGVKRPVLCLSCDPPKRFASVAEAAGWAGVRHPSMIRALKRPKPGQRRRTCCKLFFVYESEYRKAG